jgi:hypothetical protein
MDKYEELLDEIDRLKVRLEISERENKRLRAALRMVLENMGGHQHWDSFGTAGVNCPVCQRQNEAAIQAMETLRAFERDA